MSIEHLETGDLVPKPPEPRSEAEIMAGWKGDPDTPLVSIVCHAYNHVHFIKDALNGFLTQETSFPFEIILNDDASTDGTQDIVKAYQNQYPRLIRATLHAENNFSKGLSPRNFSFPKVRGTYIALCEGDDFWISSQKLQKQVDAFEEGVSVVFHDAIPSSDERALDNSYYKNDTAPLKGYSPNQMARGAKIPTASSVFLAKPFKKEKHENVVNGDHLIWATLAEFGKALFLPEALSVYRYHEGGIWSSRKILERVEPALRSKEVIFDCVVGKYKTSAMLGFCGTMIELVDQLLIEGEKDRASSLTRSLYFQVLKMLPRCRIYDVENLKDMILVMRLLGLSAPKAWINMRRSG